MRLFLSVTIESLAIIARRGKIADTSEELRQAFRVLNCQNSRTISARELRQVMISTSEDLSDEQIDNIIRQADQDGDGTID